MRSHACPTRALSNAPAVFALVAKTRRNATRKHDRTRRELQQYRLYETRAALLLSRKHQPLPPGIMAAISYSRMPLRRLVRPFRTRGPPYNSGTPLMSIEAIIIRVLRALLFPNLRKIFTRNSVTEHTHYVTNVNAMRVARDFEII